MDDFSELERELLAKMSPHRSNVLCKIIDRDSPFEDCDICQVIAIGDQSYTSKKGKIIEVPFKRGDLVIIPRKWGRLATAELTLEYFLIDIFEILGLWMKS